MATNVPRLLWAALAGAAVMFLVRGRAADDRELWWSALWLPLIVWRFGAPPALLPEWDMRRPARLVLAGLAGGTGIGATAAWLDHGASTGEWFVLGKGIFICSILGLATPNFLGDAPPAPASPPKSEIPWSRYFLEFLIADNLLDSLMWAISGPRHFTGLSVLLWFAVLAALARARRGGC